MKNEIVEYRRRWELVRAAEIEELRKTSQAEKALQTAALMESARRLGWMDRRDQREDEVWSRWNALRKAKRV